MVFCGLISDNEQDQVLFDSLFLKKIREREEEHFLDEFLKEYGIYFGVQEDENTRVLRVNNSIHNQDSFLTNADETFNLNTLDNSTVEEEKKDPYDLLGLNIKSILETEVYLA